MSEMRCITDKQGRCRCNEWLEESLTRVYTDTARFRETTEKKLAATLKENAILKAELEMVGFHARDSERDATYWSYQAGNARSEQREANATIDTLKAERDALALANVSLQKIAAGFNATIAEVRTGLEGLLEANSMGMSQSAITMVVNGILDRIDGDATNSSTRETK